MIPPHITTFAKTFPLKIITSIQNPLVKHWVQLQEKARVRKQTGQFLLEGKRELELALKGGYQPVQLMYCPELGGNPELLPKTPGAELIELSKAVYQKLAYRDTTEGLLALVTAKEHRLEHLQLPENPLILVAEGIEKPGNVGALLRTGDAARIDAVILANPRSDVYNPNTIRSSVGCVFTTPIALAPTEDVIDFLQYKNIAIYSAILQEAQPYHNQDYTTPTALVVGTEATGLTEAWRTASTQNIIIPMQGAIDSMNVSVAAAILLFEAKRQRGF